MFVEMKASVRAGLAGCWLSGIPARALRAGEVAGMMGFAGEHVLRP